MTNISKQYESLVKILTTFYHKDQGERTGFIKGESRIIEVPNISGQPSDSFRVSPENILKYTEEERCWATWHTHPNETSNLSGEDYYTFKAWGDMTHFIIGSDGVRAYKWNKEKKAVLNVPL